MSLYAVLPHLSFGNGVNDGVRYIQTIVEALETHWRRHIYFSFAVYQETNPNMGLKKSSKSIFHNE